MTALELFIGVLTLVTNAFFVGGEFSLVAVRRTQIEPRAEAGQRRARTVMWGLEHVSGLLATAQLGVTASSLVLGAVAEPAISHLLEPALKDIGLPSGLIRTIAFVIALSLATYAHMLFGEMVPKNIALAAPERTALLLVPPLVGLTRALRPLVAAINAAANGVLRALRVEVRDEVSSVFTEEDLVALVADSSRAHQLPERETELAQEVLDLGRRPVEGVLRPLADAVCAGPDVTPAELEQLAARTGYSRFPVRDGVEILGYLHVKDVLGAVPGAPFPPADLRPVARVAAQTPLDDVLDAMRRSGTHLAVAGDADGVPVGLVTLQDVLADLIGPAV
jgi:CBS domain containing-hemolysin-like protein